MDTAAQMQTSSAVAQETAAQPPQQQPHDDGTGNVDKIRDILFGGHMRDYEARFRKLEEKLAQDTAAVREDAKQRLDALEDYIKKEFEAQSQRLRAERDERNAHFDRHGQDLRDTAQTVTRKIADTNDAMAEAQRSIREEILSRSTSLLQELQHRHQESATNVDRYVSELRDAKADRATIAALLTEMAMRLTGEFKLPGKE